jgi:lysophospholipase L1-like esterase
VTRVVALGDSFSCGEGVGVRVPPEVTWPALLAAALPGASFISYAVPGARVRDVSRDQVPLVSAASIVTVLVGLNDVARSSFDPLTVYEELVGVAERLSEVAEIVLLGRLHDPMRMLRLPAPIRRLAQARIAVVNAAVDEAARLPGVHVLDLDQVDGFRLAHAWAVDRVHPSAIGHAALARAGAAMLGAEGHLVETIAPVPPSRVVTQRDRMLWLAGHGVPYLARNLRSLGTPALESVLRRA